MSADGLGVIMLAVGNESDVVDMLAVLIGAVVVDAIVVESTPRPEFCLGIRWAVDRAENKHDTMMEALQECLNILCYG